MNRSKELLEELKMVLGGSTMDAIAPPVLFLVLNRSLGLVAAVALSIICASGFFMIRLMQKRSWTYAIGGLVGVVFASGIAYVNQQAESFFLPDLIGNVFILLLAVVTLLLKKPLAAWVSHLTRGWPIDWYWRADIQPAYQNVTIGWACFFLVRVLLQLILFSQGSFEALAIYSIVMGLPVTIIVLLITYVYGIWKLHQLGGPGSDEYSRGEQAPWKGQTRGF